MIDLKKIYDQVYKILE